MLVGCRHSSLLATTQPGMRFLLNHSITMADPCLCSVQTTWCLFELAKKPDIQTRLREELLSVPTETPSMDELNALPYLDNVIREILRLRPAAPKTGRVAMQNCIIPVNEPFTDRKGRVQTEIKRVIFQPTFPVSSCFA